jgi:hypothetical protein
MFRPRAEDAWSPADAALDIAVAAAFGSPPGWRGNFCQRCLPNSCPASIWFHSERSRLPMFIANRSRSRLAEKKLAQERSALGGQQHSSRSQVKPVRISSRQAHRKLDSSASNRSTRGADTPRATRSRTKAAAFSTRRPEKLFPRLRRGRSNRTWRAADMEGNCRAYVSADNRAEALADQIEHERIESKAHLQAGDQRRKQLLRARNQDHIGCVTSDNSENGASNSSRHCVRLFDDPTRLLAPQQVGDYIPGFFALRRRLRLTASGVFSPFISP